MQGTISRRSFITGAAMAGVAAATASAAVASVIDPSEEALAATAGFRSGGRPSVQHSSGALQARVAG